MPTTTVLDRRPALWQVRRRAMDRIALLQRQRRNICGCPQCADDDRGEELDYLIRLGLAQIRDIEDRICEGNTP